MSAKPTWFGPVDRPLAGWLHTPDTGSSRGGVVVCPPIGLEYVNSHRALYQLAELLADRGLTALRFDYDGMGDSAGSMTDPDRVTSWVASAAAALDYSKMVVGDRPLGLVGLRLGATIGVHAVQSGTPELLAMVAWDPAATGRRFLREQAALGRMIGCDLLADGAVDAAGIRYEAATAAEIEMLDLGKIATPPAQSNLLLHRATNPPKAKQLGSLATDSAAEPIDGQDAFLDVPSPQAETPFGTVRRIVDWLDETFPGEHSQISFQPRLEANIPSATGAPLIERMVQIGPHGLFAIDSQPVGEPTGHTVMFLNNAVESHVGPVRLWTDSARLWAAAGTRTIRIDLSGIGDSPPRPGNDVDIMYADGSVADVLEFAEQLQVPLDELTLVGLCSGAHLAIYAGAQLGVDSVIALNPVTTEFLTPRPSGSTVYFGPKTQLPRKILAALRLHDAARKVATRVRAMLPHVPAVAWRLVSAAHLSVSPGVGLRQLTDTPTLLVCGPEDSYGYVTRGKWDLTHMQRRSSFKFQHVADLDHVPMPYRQRVVITDVMTQYIHDRTAAKAAARISA